MKNNLLEEHIAEAKLWRMDMDDKMEILCKGFCSKFRRVLKKLWRPDLYDCILP
jgi:hypothetical protein